MKYISQVIFICVIIFMIACTGNDTYYNSSTIGSNVEKNVKQYLTYLLDSNMEQVFNNMYPGAEKIYLIRTGIKNYEELRKTLIEPVDKEEIQQINKNMNASIEIDEIVCEVIDENKKAYAVSSYIRAEKKEIKYRKKGITAAILLDRNSKWYFFSLSNVENELVREILNAEFNDSTLIELTTCLDKYRMSQNENLDISNDLFKIRDKLSKYFDLFKQKNTREIRKYIYPKVFEYVDNKHGPGKEELFYFNLDNEKLWGDDVKFEIKKIYSPVKNEKQVIQLLDYEIVQFEEGWEKYYESTIVAISKDAGRKWSYFELDNLAETKEILEIEHSNDMINEVLSTKQ
jgi:hypothetical protein